MKIVNKTSFEPGVISVFLKKEERRKNGGGKVRKWCKRASNGVQ